MELNAVAQSQESKAKLNKKDEEIMTINERLKETENKLYK